MLQNKHILLGISGGIAAYKSPELVRRLRERGAQVRVIMTAGAQAFVTPLTFQAVSGERVHTSLLDAEAEAAMGHIELARWADAVLIAPASADCIARITHGHADDLLTTTCLATSAPLMLAPAMNQQMWRAAATQENCQRLQDRGVYLLGPASGAQACGETGTGRMLEPSELVNCLTDLLSAGNQLQGMKVLVTAGPTHEDIDPVRYITNRSSGRMGYSMAAAACTAGANVTLVSGPVSLSAPSGVTRIDVYSAQDMFNAVIEQIADTNIFIAAAAVADYRPAEIATQKLKKVQIDEMHIVLTRNADILTHVAALPQPPFTVGFAAETNDVEHYARDKLQRKRLNMIAANQVGIPGQGFDSEQNALHVFWADGEQVLPLNSKTLLARQLITLISAQYWREKPGKPQEQTFHSQIPDA